LGELFIQEDDSYKYRTRATKIERNSN